MTDLKPGRELDALVAEKVMGIKDVQITPGLGPVYDFTGAQGMPRKHVPNYSTDIAAAWEVVERMRPENAVTIHDGGLGRWMCHIGRNGKAIGDTAPHAICLAALKAVSGD